jgi:hypothetical protein
MNMNDKSQCEHTEELVSFLYGELEEKAQRAFQQHVRGCASCERELTLFGQVRNSITEWRDLTLGAIEPNNGVVVPARPSALAALRNFFNLSPLWLKGAAAFASVLFCVCAVLAIAYLKTPTPQIVVNPGDKLYSQKELDQQVAKAVQDQEQKLRQSRPTETANSENVIAVVQPKRVDRMKPRTANYAINRDNMRKPLTRQERRELAADLGLLGRDEDELVLVTDKISQTP